MNTDEHRYEMDEVTERIIGCAYRVSNGLGRGFVFARLRVEVRRLVG